MEKLAEYRSSDEEHNSSEGLCESDEDGFNKPRLAMDSHSRNKERKEKLETGSSSNEFPEEGEIVTNQLQNDSSTKKREDLHKRPVKTRALVVVAFSACMRLCQDTLKPTDVIPFDRVTMNYGKGYHTEDNTFVCPLAGTYMITMRIVLTRERDVVINLVVNGVDRNRVTFDCTNSKNNERCECEDMIRLAKGDKVYLTLHSGDGSLLRPRKCKFAGIRLMT